MDYFKKYVVIIIAIGAVLFTSCVDDDDGGNVKPGINSALDQTVNREELSMLNTALVRTSLDATLQASGNLTVFAPTNAAFNEYLTNNGFASIEAIPIMELRTLLLYHVLNTKITTEVLASGYVKTLAKDEEIESLDLYIEAGTTVLLNGSTSITTEDIELDNGVMHIVDQVLELPTITTLIAANVDFSNLETALSQTGLDGTLSSDLGTMQAPFTIFAPNDAAFQALIDLDSMDGLNTVQDILDLVNLNDILRYHVVGNDRLRAGDISNGLMVNPITTGNFTIDTSMGTSITDGQMQQSTVTSTDVTAFNGIIHTINLVIRP